MAPTLYPNFPDGDVLIVSPTGRQWKLHSWVLEYHSTGLREILKGIEPRHITKGMAQEGATIKWKLEMKEDPEDQRFCKFDAVQMKKKGTYHIPDNISGEGSIQFEIIYDNLFRILYNLNPNITEEIFHDNGNAYILDCVGILQAAERIGATPAVRAQVEKYLLRMSQPFWVHVAKSPEAWADIAMRLESPLILQEAICHLAGTWELGGTLKKGSIQNKQYEQVILRLVEKKAKQLKEKQLMVERRLVQFFPARLVHPETPTKIPGRADYGTDIYLWQALTIVRQFITSSMLANRHHRCADGGVEFYRTIQRMDYTDKKALDDFHILFGMSTKGKQCLAEAVEVVKGDVRAVVADLLTEELQLRVSERSRPRRYLTCTKVEKEELPWVADADEFASLATMTGNARPIGMPNVSRNGAGLNGSDDRGEDADAENGRGEEEVVEGRGEGEVEAEADVVGAV